MTFDDIVARFDRGTVPHPEYLALTGDLVRLGFRLVTPGLHRHEWRSGRRRLRLAYHGVTRTWTLDRAAGREEGAAPALDLPGTRPPACRRPG